VIIPTYDEAENGGPITSAVRDALPEASLLVVDDNSPDGTGRLADEIAARDPKVRVLHRAGKEGLGRAYLDAFRWGLAHGYEYLLEFDADFSHDPKYLPAMIDAMADADVAVGSRYVAGGGTRNWGLGRKIISAGGSLYSRTVLGVRVRDLTGGFLCWHRHVLEAIDLDRVGAAGFAFQIEMKYRAVLQGFRVVEVPIVFTDRRAGTSKMSGGIFFEALFKVWGLRFRVRREVKERLRGSG
jgi:dolichol-phosphate mannosyltransferase